MNHPIRTFLFQHYWWITVLVAGVAIPIIISVSRPDTVATSVVAVCVGALGVVYFVQKQKLEELQLFQKLFTDFNNRYAAQHADLQKIVNGLVPDANEVRTVLDGYFNLCAEEYLFYAQGRILPNVWRAWCRGMQTYLANEVVRKHWAVEVSADSHYGLTTEVIQRGAA